MRLRILIAALMMGATATACGRNAGVESGQVQPASGAAVVRVTNDYQLSMSVYAVGNNQVVTKLGTVGGGMSDAFSINPGLMRLGMLQIIAQPTGGGRVVSTGPLALEPGNVVEFNIGSHLSNTITSLK